MVGKKTVANTQSGNEPIFKPKSKRMRDENAPKVPANAYSRFIKSNLQKLRKDGENARETQSKLAAKWAKMTDGEKEPYYNEYKNDLDVYYKKMEIYKETDQYKDYRARQLQKRRQSWKRVKTDNNKIKNEPKEKSKTDDSKNFIPNGINIFTKEFLDYNKEQERKLKDVRKQKSNMEEECNRIKEHITQINDQIQQIMMENLEHERNLTKIENTISSWHETIIAELDKNKLLNTLKLDRQMSATEMMLRLEDIATASTNEESTDDKRLFLSVKHAISNIHLVSL